MTSKMFGSWAERRVLVFVIMLIMLLHYYGCNTKLKICKFGTTSL
jgi:hypothetical protein